MSTALAILQDIEKFIERHDMPPTTFGMLACSDPHVVRYLRKGGGITGRRIDRIREFMRDYQPAKKRQREAA